MADHGEAVRPVHSGYLCRLILSTHAGGTIPSSQLVGTPYQLTRCNVPPAGACGFRKAKGWSVKAISRFSSARFGLRLRATLMRLQFAVGQLPVACHQVGI